MPNAATRAPLGIVDAGVDYLTCTFGESSNHARLESYIRHAQRVEKREGNFVRAWNASGYTGEKCGGLEWGYRYDGAIVRLSGFSAFRWWRRFGALASNCSRIDLQVTAVYDEHWSKTVNRHWREMKRYYRAGKRRPEPKLIAGPSGGETLYSGARVSDVFLRCYHRGSRKHCSDAVGHIRYEVELKNERAWCTLADLKVYGRQDSFAIATSSHAFVARGCRLCLKEDAIPRSRAPIRNPDAQRCLRWIRSAVRPTVERIIEAGRGAEVIEALGLSQMVHMDHDT